MIPSQHAALYKLFLIRQWNTVQDVNHLIGVRFIDAYINERIDIAVAHYDWRDRCPLLTYIVRRNGQVSSVKKKPIDEDVVEDAAWNKYSRQLGYVTRCGHSVEIPYYFWDDYYVINKRFYGCTRNDGILPHIYSWQENAITLMAIPFLVTLGPFIIVLSMYMTS